ncbi:MAG: sigma-70 family RNA polymerase sigma factor [Dokdonella sp.]
MGNTALRRFVRGFVPDLADAEDIVQEVFFEFVEAARLLKPIEQVGAWLFRVARNRINDRFRRRRFEASVSTSAADGEEPSIFELLPDPAASPEAAFARGLLLDELDAALDELPAEQRSMFRRPRTRGSQPHPFPPRPASASTRCCRASVMPCCTCAGACRRSTTRS